MNPADGGTLWSAWRARREPEAFDALVRREAPYALDLARRMGATHADAEDALQESLLLLAREKSDDPVRVGVRAWLCRRVVLRTRMQRRAALRRRRHERAAPPPRSSGTVRAELRDEVEAALDHLDEEQRRAVVLRFLHDLDYEEIAYVLGVTPNACRVRVHKALKRLRAVLGGHAPALIAAIALPVCKANVAAVALGTAKKAAALAGAGAAGTALKTGAAATLVAGAVTTTVLLWPRDERPPPIPPPARVARAEPGRPASPPTPPAAPVADPAPPPVVAQRPAALVALDQHLSGVRDLTATLWNWEEVRGTVAIPDGPVRSFQAEADGETEVDPASLSPDVRVLAFGPGRFRLKAPIRLAAGAALEIRGAGSDATVLAGDGLLSLPEGDGQVVIRDFAFEGGPLLDAGASAAAVAERVTVRAWGAGGAIRVAGRAWLGLRGCTFLGGWRRPAGGSALAVRGAALALFEDCRFIDLEHAVAGRDAHRRSRVHLLRGELRNGVHRQRGAPFPVERRDCVALLEPRCDVGALLAVLDAFRPAAGERVRAIRALAWEGLSEPFFEVHLTDGTGARRRVVLQGGAPVDDPGLEPARLPECPGPRTPMTEILRAHRWKLDLTEEASAIVEWEVQGEKSGIPTVSVLDRYGAPLAHLTESGELQR